MSSKPLHSILFILVAIGPLLLSSCTGEAGIQPFSNQVYMGVSESIFVPGSIYEQPVNQNGTLLLSSWLDPDGSDYDQYIWDNFTLQSNETITEIRWFGVYDPQRFGAGGPVVDFSLSVYPSITAGTEPNIANPPLVRYQIGGNAGETAIGTASGNTLYAYAFTLPTPLTASAGVKYWVQIEAYQHGSSPDWCLAAGTGGDARHFRRTSGAGGDIMYRLAPGDAAFTLVGLVSATATPTDTPTDTPTNVSTDTPTETATQLPTDTRTSTATETSTATQTPTETFTATLTFTETSTSTPTDTSTVFPTATATPSQTQTPPDLVTSTPTDSPMPTETPTPTPLSSIPGKVTGGGNIDLDQEGGKATFAFEIRYNPGDAAPDGNLTYQDHKANLRLKATSFDLLSMEGNSVSITGTGIMDDGQAVSFSLELDGLSNMLYISIPTLNGYQAGGTLSGGNITIH